jgi:hypothetical protein
MMEVPELFEGAVNLGQRLLWLETYVKRTARHKVRGKEIRYVVCVYVAPAPEIGYYQG